VVGLWDEAGEFDPVFFGGEESGAGGEGVDEVACFVGGPVVVVGLDDGACDVERVGGGGVEEGGGVTDAERGDGVEGAEGVEWLTLVADHEGGPLVSGGGDDGAFVALADAAGEAFDGGWGDGVDAGDHDDVGAGEAFDRFAEPAGGEELVDEGVAGGVDEDDVEVAVEFAVLEAVVEEDGVGGAAFDEATGGVGAEGVGFDGDAGEGGFVFELFVGFFAGLGFVAPHGDAGGAAELAEEVGEIGDHGGFAGAADGEVADADDGCVDALDVAAAVEAFVAGADGGGVEGGEEVAGGRGEGPEGWGEGRTRAGVWRGGAGGGVGLVGMRRGVWVHGW